MDYIRDPELKYMKKQPKGIKSIIIFNAICRKINEVISNYTGLKFFMRRTISGCEFGVCFDFKITNNAKEIVQNENCIVDKDLLLLFTINVKSQVPVMAGILIIGIVYIAKIAKSITEWITTCGAKMSFDLITKTVKFVLEQRATKLFDDKIEKFCASIDSFLLKILKKQIKSLNVYLPEKASLFEMLMMIVIENGFIQSVNSINKIFNEKSSFKMNSTFGSGFIAEHLPVKHFLKIGLLLMLCFASFMFNFHHQRVALAYDTGAVALEYDLNQDVEKELQSNSKFVKQEKFDEKL